MQRKDGPAGLGIALLALGLAGAATAGDFGPGSGERRADEVLAAQTRDYERVLRALDAHARESPGDAVAAVERCRFILMFAWSVDLVVERAPADHERCVAELRSGPIARDADVELYLLDQTHGEEAVAAAQDLLARSAGWPQAKRAALHKQAAAAYRDTGDAARAGDHAIEAMRLDSTQDVRLQAARRLAEMGAVPAAKSAIETAPPEAWERESRFEAAALLVELGDPAAAVRLVGDLDGASEVDEFDRFTLARALAGAGEIGAARKLYDAAAEGANVRWASEGLRGRFLFELEHGSRESAEAAYAAIRAERAYGDPLARYRLALAMRHSDAAWEPGDFVGLAAVAGLLVGMAIAPGLLLVAPVHYRGLARRVRGRAPAGIGLPWHLRHAWYAIAAYLVAGIVAFYAFAYPALEEQLGWANASADARPLARMLLWQTLLFTILAVPLLRVPGAFRAMRGRWTVTRSLLAGVAGAVLVNALAFAWTWATAGGPGRPRLGDDTTRAIQSILTDYGMWATLAVVGVWVPICEELIFRGALLGGLARHLSFGTAVILQAGLFAAAHGELSRVPFLVAISLVAAWYTRQSGGLLAAIAMHAANNLWVSGALIHVTRLLRGD